MDVLLLKGSHYGCLLCFKCIVMIPEQINHITDRYFKKLYDLGLKPRCHKGDLNGSLYPVEHILWMCQEIKEISRQDMEKACRWLGFIQGILWVRGLYSIDELRRHTKPPE